MKIIIILLSLMFCINSVFSDTKNLGYVNSYRIGQYGTDTVEITFTTPNGAGFKYATDDKWYFYGMTNGTTEISSVKQNLDDVLNAGNSSNIHMYLTSGLTATDITCDKITANDFKHIKIYDDTVDLQIYMDKNMVEITPDVTVNKLTVSDHADIKIISTDYIQTSTISAPIESYNWALRNINPFTAVINQCIISFGNKLYNIAGRDISGIYTDNIYSTANGTSWTTETIAPGFTGRDLAGGCVFDSKMWIMGGRANSATVYLSDVWYSSDGVTWTQATASAGWGRRTISDVVVLGTKMYIYGGRDDAGNYYDDVWSSPDGITWTQITASATGTSRWLNAMCVHDNKLWIYGGNSSTGNILGDVWSSADGITWVNTANITDSYLSTMISFHNEIHIILGSDGANTSSDVWTSTDGITWTQEISSVNPDDHRNWKSAIFENDLYIISGANSSGIVESYVFSHGSDDYGVLNINGQLRACNGIGTCTELTTGVKLLIHDSGVDHNIPKDTFGAYYVKNDKPYFMDDSGVTYDLTDTGIASIAVSDDGISQGQFTQLDFRDCTTSNDGTVIQITPNTTVSSSQFLYNYNHNNGGGSSFTIDLTSESTNDGEIYRLVKVYQISDGLNITDSVNINCDTINEVDIDLVSDQNVKVVYSSNKLTSNNVHTYTHSSGAGATFTIDLSSEGTDDGSIYRDVKVYRTSDGLDITSSINITCDTADEIDVDLVSDQSVQVVYTTN